MNKQSRIILRSNQRGYFDFGWLKTYHTFSFGDYYNENFMGFESLRVINDDVVLAKNGFSLHPHKNMEIITYIIKGTLTHSDNLGNKEEIKTGEVQVMSAGSGIEHSEWNHSKEECHLLQIWIKPSTLGGTPSYKIYKPEHFEKWGLVASGFDSGSDDNDKINTNAVKIKQKAMVYVINSGSIDKINLPELSSNKIWIHIATGEINFSDLTLKSGDGIGLRDYQADKEIYFKQRQTKLMLFCL